MKANNFNLWFRLTVGSAIGAIVYHFSSGRKTEKLRKMVRMRNQIKESENKGEIYTLSLMPDDKLHVCLSPVSDR